MIQRLPIDRIQCKIESNRSNPKFYSSAFSSMSLVTFRRVVLCSVKFYLGALKTIEQGNALMVIGNWYKS